MESGVCNALAERLGEVLNEFAEANEITINEVMQTLDYVYATVEQRTEATSWRRMH